MKVADRNNQTFFLKIALHANASPSKLIWLPAGTSASRLQVLLQISPFASCARNCARRKQDRAWVGATSRKGFVNSAGTAGPIRMRDGSFDAPERRNDDGGGHVALRATWHVPRAAAWTLRKMSFQGCSPNGKWPRAQTFRSEAPWSEMCAIGRISHEGSKLCPQGAILFFFSLMPSSSDTLRPRDPKIGARMHVSKGYPNMHN